MPNKCCVPRCRGNYDKENKVAVFQFPRDENLKKKWLQKISRENFEPTKNSRVCELHFAPSYIETHAEFFDEKQGKVISAKLERIRLKQNAVPTIFPDYPSYLSNAAKARESPDKKKSRAEERNMQAAIEDSLASKYSFDKKREFNNIEELGNCLLNFKPSAFWDIIRKNNCIIFLNLQTESDNVILNYSVVINEKLHLGLSYKGEVVNSFSSYKFPVFVNNINNVLNILEAIELNHINSKEKPQIATIISLINNLAEEVDDDKKISLNFLKEQISLMFTKPENYRYSPDTLIFACMFYLISPTAYRFIRQSSELILPHPSTIQRVTAKCNVNPLDEKENFLAYAKQRVKTLEKHELYVSLMIDEIHLKDFFDFKGGNIVGFAHDSVESANSAHVFMLHSLFSKFKDVIYILPVKKITADILFKILKKIIIKLEEFGFNVIVIVTDNNSINRKCVSYFNNPSANYVYPHPCNLERPLFYCVDPVHIIKSVRNNWVNQRNGEQAMYYPNFDTTSNEILTASLLSVKKLYEIESGNLLKYGYTLSQKALWPSSLEKQNVKLALQLFNTIVSKSLQNVGETNNILNCSGTATYIELFHKWFSIMNVKSPHKGSRLKDDFCTPLTYNENDDKLIFLCNFLDWLEKWGKLNHGCGKLTRETHSALLITTNCIIQLTKYCISELKMSYLLPGKIQTDELEERFSLYRRMAGTHYHISMRQILEVEKKLRTCKVLKLTLESKFKGTIHVNEFMSDTENVNFSENNPTFLNDIFSSVFVTDNDIDQEQKQFPLITFLAGYCAHSVLHINLKCDTCQNNLTIDRALVFEPNYKVIMDFDRGGLKYPTIDVVNIVAHNYVVIKKLISELETDFLKESNHRQVAIQITLNILSTKNIFVVDCEKHSSSKLMLLIVRATTNTLLKNYCKTKNDSIARTQNKRKLNTLTKK